MSTINAIKEQAVRDTIKKICHPNNTFTTVELKQELIKDYPAFRWTQKDVSSTEINVVSDMIRDNELTPVADNGTYRTYSLTINIVNAMKAKAKTKVPATATVAASPANTVTKTVKQPTQKVVGKKISRTKAYDIMKETKGRFFTACFASKKDDERVINCQFIKDQNPLLGYVKVRETSKLKTSPNDAIRQINLNTLKWIRVSGETLKVS